MRSIVFAENGGVRAGWRAAGFFLAAGLCFFLVGISRHFVPAPIKVYLPNALLLTVAIGVLTWAVTRIEHRSLASVGLRLDQTFVVQFLLGTAFGMAMIAVIALVVYLCDGFHLVRNDTKTVLALCSDAMTCLAIAIFEEISFRGYGYQRTVDSIGAFRATVIIGIFFTIAHLPGNLDVPPVELTVALANIFLAAVLLSLCYLRTGSLALPMGIHLGWNWLQGTLGFGVSGEVSRGWWTPIHHGRADWVTGGAFGLEASVAALVVLACAIFCVARMAGAQGQGVAELIPAEAR
jgi:uncharacterized protein